MTRLTRSSGRPALPARLLLAVLAAVALTGAKPAAAQPAGGALDAATRAMVVEEIIALLAEHHLFPDKAEDCREHLQARLAEGAYDEIADPFDFARLLTRDLRTVNDDAHLRVEYGRRSAFREADDVDEAEARRLRYEGFRASNFGFHKFELLDGVIGYLDLRQFAPADVAGETAVAAMNLLANTDAVIIDVRRNGGGSGDMIQLIAGYFFEESTHLCSYETRGEDLITQSWSPAHVTGKTMYDTPLFILTSGRTASAAEEFTYDFKHLDRATIIGETTGGGGHTCISRRVADLFDLVIPHGRPIHPVTGTDWDGIGVHPDIEISADKALLKGRYEALKTLAAEADDEKAARLGRAIEAVRAELDPVVLPEETLQEYVGDYGGVGVIVENGVLYAVDGSDRMRLIPLGGERFLVEGEGDHVQIIRDDDGKVIAVEVIMASGRVTRVPRDPWDDELAAAKRDPVDVPLATLRTYVGDFGPRHIISENGALHYQRDERDPFRLIPMTATLFRLKGKDDFRIEFELGDDGEVTAIIGRYKGGHTDRNERDG